MLTVVCGFNASRPNSLSLVYATADEGMRICFTHVFLFFCFFLLFRPSQKYQTTVLGNG